MGVISGLETTALQGSICLKAKILFQWVYFRQRQKNKNKNKKIKPTYSHLNAELHRRAKQYPRNEEQKETKPDPAGFTRCAFPAFSRGAQKVGLHPRTDPPPTHPPFAAESSAKSQAVSFLAQCDLG